MIRLLAPLLVLVSVPTLRATPQDVREGPRVDFNRDVRPVLADRCFHCHGPDAQERKASLRLDRPDGPEGALRERKGRTAIVPGQPAASEVIRRLTTDDASERMPPEDSHKARLTAIEIAKLRRWVEDGAEYEDHWSFVAPKKPVLPPVVAGYESWTSAIDRFIARRLDDEGLAPKPRTDRRSMIRRVTLDLTGLPPTREEIRAFDADDRPDAYERLVDGLLARPQHGEHMARFWLDLVRFADTNGIHHDHFRDMSPYRDWVIRAFRDNMPYDDFVTDQLAGDLRPNATDDQKIASGFHRLHLIIDVGTALPEESFTRNVIDRVTAFGTAFLGLTVQCAVCHDHKYDPISQRDFFGLYAFFNNLDGKPETGGRRGPDFWRGLQPPYVSFPKPGQATQLAGFAEKISAAEDELAALKPPKEPSGEGEKLESVEESPAQKKLRVARRKKVQERLKKLRQQRDGVMRGVRGAMVMKERTEVRTAHVLIRGQYDKKGDEVARGTPEFLPALTTEDDVPSRMDLARWLLSPSHPLTARVFVNRIWQQFFGVGLVKTSEDFGLQGEWPSHPDLLDELAVTFVESGWDVRALVRRIVQSEAYRQSSSASPGDYARDPENRSLARGPRYRMDAEMIRDAMLATSGLLNRSMFGRSVKPPQPKGLWKAVALPSSYPRIHVPDKGAKSYRRSLYTFWKRGLPPPQMTLLDAPTRESCVARRERTNTPLQALLMLNEKQCLEASRAVARRALGAASFRRARIAWLYEEITSSSLDAREAATLSSLFSTLEERYLGEPRLAEDLCGGSIPADSTGASFAAWVVLASTIYNLDVFKTKG